MRTSSRPAVLPREAVQVPTSRWAPGDFAATTRPVGAGAAEAQARAARDAEAALQAEMERRIADAYEQGHADGRAEAEQSDAVRLRNAVAVAEAALLQVREHEALWRENAQENIAALAVAVARHILGRELSTDPTAVADLVRRAVAEFPIDQPMRVRVHPHDLSLLAAPTPSAGGAIPIAPNRDIQWMADARITPGGCVVEGRERIIDGRVDTALERVYRKVSATNA